MTYEWGCTVYYIIDNLLDMDESVVIDFKDSKESDAEASKDDDANFQPL